ncbi:MAG: tyrosine-protein kinase [Thermoleophilaceae bacterium]|jgi:succinoglycan biosynthesis transport protein ExoP|nr:tyrosine-protein kinase [Thermoleophilaceae bacterium]
MTPATMSRVRHDTPLTIMWRRKSVIIATFLAFTVTTAIVSKTLPKVYSTHSTLLISLPADRGTFDSVQASQALARSYADIIASPNIAQLVANRIGGDNDKIGKAATFEPVSETQLLRIDAEDQDPGRAKQIADTYAVVFIDYARRNLTQSTRATITLADAAPKPSSPARPKPTLYTLIAAILGAALGVALAFLRDRLDHRLRTSGDVESRFDKPVLARVPRRGRSETSITAFREAHRILRTNLQFATGGKQLRSIAVTSGREGEGKTTTVAQLALASAEVGQNVVVVEADFRRPALQRELLPDAQEPLRPGLTNYLVEAATLDDVIYPAPRPNIDIVPAGPLPPSPSALLESRRGHGFVEDILTDADLVIIDCPPLSIGADASVISGWVDGVLMVVDLGGSTDQTVRDALRQLEAVQANVLGLVLNRDRGAEPSSYDYYLTAPEDAKKELAKSGSRRS